MEANSKCTLHHPLPHHFTPPPGPLKVGVRCKPGGVWSKSSSKSFSHIIKTPLLSKRVSVGPADAGGVRGAQSLKPSSLPDVSAGGQRAWRAASSSIRGVSSRAASPTHPGGDEGTWSPRWKCCQTGSCGRRPISRLKLPTYHRRDGTCLSLMATGWAPPQGVSDILGGGGGFWHGSIRPHCAASFDLKCPLKTRQRCPSLKNSSISGASSLLQVLNVSGLQAQPRPSDLIRLEAAPPADLSRRVYHFWGVEKVFISGRTSKARKLLERRYSGFVLWPTKHYRTKYMGSIRSGAGHLGTQDPPPK